MMQLTVFLVVGMALASPALASTIPYLFEVCSEKPSPSACVTEAKECFRLLEIDFVDGLTTPEPDTICIDIESEEECVAKYSMCSDLFSLDITKNASPGPATPGSSAIVIETGDPSGPSPSNYYHGFSKGNLEVLCQFLGIPNCSLQVDKCFGLTENHTLEYEELLKCQAFYTSLSEAAKILPDSVGIPGRPGNTGPGLTGSSSTPSPTEEFVFSGASMEQMCQFVDIPDCLQQVRKCSLIMGPDVPVSVIPTRDMLECSTFFVSLAEAAGNITDSIGVSGGPGGSVSGVFNGSSSTPSPPEGSFPSKLTMLVMCQFVEIPDCQKQVDRCIGIVGSGAPPPSFPNKELLECSAFFESLADGAANFTDTIGVTGGPGGSGLGSSSTPSSPGESFPSKESMKVVCVLVDIPNCPEQVDRCFDIAGPGAPPPSFINKEVLECSAFFVSLAEGAANFTDTTEVTGGPGGSGLGSSSTPSPTGESFPSKESMLVMCQFVEIPDCQKQVDRCFVVVGSGAPPPTFPIKELLECSSFMESLANGAANFTGELGITDGPGGSGHGIFGSSSTPSPSEESFPSKASMKVVCVLVEIPNCPEQVDKCFAIAGPGAPPPSFLNKEVLECSAFFESLANGTANITGESGVTDGPGSSGLGVLGSSSTPFPSEESFPSKSSMEVMCQFVEIPDCLERVDKCFGIVGPDAAPEHSFPTPETLECLAFFASLEGATGNLTGTVEVTDGPGDQVFGSSSTPSPSEESVPSRETVEFMCQSIDITNCVERVEKCFRIQGSGMPDPSTPIKELLECSKLLEPLATAVVNFTNIGNLTVSGNLTDILPCRDEKCKTCEKMIEPTPDFLKEGQRCLFEVAGGDPETLSLKECMKPAMETLLNAAGTSEFRPKLLGFFESCYPNYELEGVRLCIIAECSKIV